MYIECLKLLLPTLLLCMYKHYSLMNVYLYEQLFSLKNTSSESLTWALNLMQLDELFGTMFKFVDPISNKAVIPPQPNNPEILGPEKSSKLQIICCMCK